MRAAGWTVAQIARHLALPPGDYLELAQGGGPPAKRTTPVEEMVVDERWRERVAELLAHND